MRVFISYSSKDKAAVHPFAEALRDRGFDIWLDAWQIPIGQDFVASINKGLDEAEASIIVFTADADASPWVKAELSYLIYARVHEQKPLIPVVLGAGATIPPLLRMLVRRGIDEIDAIAEALRHRGTPRPAPSPEQGRVIPVVISLQRQAGAIRTTVRIDGDLHGDHTVPALPPDLANAQAAFFQGYRHGAREFRANDHASQSAELATLGRALGKLCFPGDSAGALAALLDGSPQGTLVEVIFEADDPQLLGLAFEAARLADDRVLALHPHAVTLRRPLGMAGRTQPPLAGPLKLLVAVAAPDEGAAGSAVLDYERELGAILDAVEPSARLDNCQVRVLEVGNPKPIGDALAHDAYHVLHLSCHGSPGALQMETEDGAAVNITAEQLLAPSRVTGRPLPLVLLNACHTGVPEGQTASLAEALLRDVPAVLAMQAPVSDHYATNLAAAFYRHLAARENPLPSRALASARRELEEARQAAVRRGGAAHETQPEYATATLFVAGSEQRLADYGQDAAPLGQPPVLRLPGPVPQLSLGELIGRRRELRETLRTLRDAGRRRAGVVLTGIGGVGKSALAGRVMCRLAEDGWLVPAVRGVFSLTDIATAVGTALRETKRPAAMDLGANLLRANLDDRERPMLLAKVLAQEPVLLVLDDFEQNLTDGGGAFRDPDVAAQLRSLAEQAQRGRLLLTYRYPVPDTADLFRGISVGPLSAAETRKKLLRLPGLLGRDAREIATALRVIGGHPRMLEFLDALLLDGSERLGPVSRRLAALAVAARVDIADTTATLADATRITLQLGARDVLLEGLLDIARGQGTAEVLLQAAVSNLPVSVAGLARMLANDGPGDPTSVRAALKRLEALSLVYRFPDGDALVHRWTADALGELEERTAVQVRRVRAGDYRMWRVENESHALDDAVEALRNYLTAEAWDAAAEVARDVFAALERFRQSVTIAALAAEVLESLPEIHLSFAAIADAEARPTCHWERQAARWHATKRCSRGTRRSPPPIPSAPITSTTSRSPTSRWATCIATWVRARQHARPSPSRWRSASGKRKPNPSAPISSASSRPPTSGWATCIARWVRARRHARPSPRRWRSASGWRKPNPSAPISSATSRSPTPRWATCIARWDRGRRHARPSPRRWQSASCWRKPNPSAPISSATSRSLTNGWATCTARWVSARRHARPSPRH
jgi:TIR domain-containing protein/CHAT domain-containing protein/AAA ATPase-like protein